MTREERHPGEWRMLRDQRYGHARVRDPIGSLAERYGIDVTRCELCDDLLDGDRPWQLGLDGAGAHHDCLVAAGVTVETPPSRDRPIH